MLGDTICVFCSKILVQLEKIHDIAQKPSPTAEASNI